MKRVGYFEGILRRILGFGNRGGSRDVGIEVVHRV